jgi:hypothetical protein
MSADSSLIKIKLGSPWMTPIKYSSPAVVSIDQNNNCKLVIKNCTPYNVTLEHTRANRTRGRFIDTFASVYNEIQEIFPNVKRKPLSRFDIVQRCKIQAPDEFCDKYIDILFKHQGSISINKYDLGLAKDFTHKIHLKMTNPVYRKQFKNPGRLS